MRTSLSRKVMAPVGTVALAGAVLATLCGYVAFQRELMHRQLSFQSRYIQEHTETIDREFSNLSGLQMDAAKEMQRRLVQLKTSDVNALMSRDYPLQSDGTRRTAPAAFDGEFHQDMLVHGLGGFLADGAHISEPEKAALVAAYPLVFEIGSATHSQYDTFYFFTPNNRVVIYRPDRPDRLMFYRRTAPASLDFSHREGVRLLTPAVNPSRVTRCTPIEHLLQDARAQADVATACVTPVYVQGQMVGGFGSTINLTTFLTKALSHAPVGATNLIIGADGALIAYPGFNRAGAATKQARFYKKNLGLRKLSARIRAQHKQTGVLISEDHRNIIGYGHVSGSDWYLIMAVPIAGLNASALRTAAWLLGLGLATAMLQTWMIVSATRYKIVGPLQALAASCGARAPGDTRSLEQRRDEIGVLASALRTERERADDLLCSLEQRVHDRTAELEHALDEKSCFLANMSHELRTPLNGVIAISETLAKEQVTPRNIELAQLIVSSGRLLEQVLTDILDFSKIEAGEMRLEHAPFDLATLVSRVARLHKASAEAKGIELAWYVDLDVQGAYLGDGVRLTQVLSNLLSNAVKFTNQGSVTAQVEAAPGGVMFSVVDSGIGFDDDVKARLFQRFEQADTSIRRRFGGTGLGLAICRSLTELMGGVIDVHSEPGRGSTFCVTLPLRPAETLVSGASAQAEPEAPLGGLRVLLAEDHPTNQRVVSLILDAVGIDLTIVENGALALDAVASQGFDVVLMDMQMPELDGLSATAMLRAREAADGAPRLPIVMLTANALDEHVRASLEAGADRHLAKPVRPADLLNAIAEVVEGAAQRQSPDRPKRSAA